MKIIKTAQYVKAIEKSPKTIELHITEDKPLSDEQMDWGVISETALNKAAETVEDTELKHSVIKGHGSRYGSCGHRMGGCRCPGFMPHAKLILNYPCRECRKRKVE
jgi:hypothetical protein